MTCKFRRNSLVVVPLVAVVIGLVAMAALAQTPRAGQWPGKSHSGFASPSLNNAGNASSYLGSRFGERPRDQTPPLFMPAMAYDSGGCYPQSIAVADVNGDGKLDLVVANPIGFPSCSWDHSAPWVGVLLGNGDGTFQPPLKISIPSEAVALADLNGDGKPDLVVVSDGAVSVLLGNGNGTFQTPVSYPMGGFSVALADLNGDGKLDIVVPGGVMLGNGDGTFQTPTSFYYGPAQGWSIAVADLNGDGKPDLVVGSSCYPCEDLVSVLLGNGDGTFQPPVFYDSGESYRSSVAIADVNGDSKPDVLVANLDAETVGVLLGNGDGTFQSVVTYSNGSASYAESVVAADINGDGKPDLLVANASGGANYDGSVGILLGNGNGTFQQVVNYDSGGGYGSSVAIADVNGDGKPDVLVANLWSNTIGVLLNNSGAPPSTTSLASSANPAALKQMVTYTATVALQSGGSLSGNVTFHDGAATVAIAPLANNQASCSTSYKGIGAHAITASYSGELHVAAGSTSAPLIEYVRGASHTSLITSGSPSLSGQPVTFTATVTSKYGKIPDGEQVMFYNGTTEIGTGTTVSGVAAFTTSSLPAGLDVIQATYAGDNTLEPSTGKVKQLVNKYPTTTALSSSLNPSQHGEAVTFTAKVTSTGPTPTGKVTFLDGTAKIGLAMLNGGVATFTTSKLAVGTHPITARYLGDADNDKSTSPVLDQVVQ